MHFPGYWDIFRYRVDPFLPVLQRLKKKYNIILKILRTLKSTSREIWDHIGLIHFVFWLETQATFSTN